MSQGDLLLTARENAPITSAEEGSVADRSSCSYSSPMDTTSIRKDLFLIIFNPENRNQPNTVLSRGFPIHTDPSYARFCQGT